MACEKHGFHSIRDIVPVVMASTGILFLAACTPYPAWYGSPVAAGYIAPFASYLPSYAVAAPVPVMMPTYAVAPPMMAPVPAVAAVPPMVMPPVMGGGARVIAYP
jgi:hypothetical protein